MILEDLKKLFGEAIDKAHFVVAGFTKNEKVEGVSLRLDSDGIMSLVFHVGHTQGRTETDESKHLKNALELYEYFGKTTAEEIDGSYVHWEILENALDGYDWPGDDETDTSGIVPRIETLLKDRNALAKEIETLKKQIKTPKVKEEPKKNSKAEKVDTVPVKSEELESWRKIKGKQGE